VLKEQPGKGNPYSHFDSNMRFIKLTGRRSNHQGDLLHLPLPALLFLEKLFRGLSCVAPLSCVWVCDKAFERRR